ncbi:MAG: hypothetical protein FJY55_11115 [Betaproteobacteria bacterium]|nr:hypothetical protein [Betaproteobacteria bacterium]
MKSPNEREPGEIEPGLLAHFVADQALDVEHRFIGLRRLLEATDRIDPGVLLDEVIRQVHETCRTIFPCERTGFALLDEGGDQLRTRWVKTSSPEPRLPADYSAPMAGSSSPT